MEETLDAINKDKYPKLHAAYEKISEMSGEIEKLNISIKALQESQGISPSEMGIIARYLHGSFNDHFQSFFSRGEGSSFTQRILDDEDFCYLASKGPEYSVFVGKKSNGFTFSYAKDIVADRNSLRAVYWWANRYLRASSRDIFFDKIAKTGIKCSNMSFSGPYVHGFVNDRTANCGAINIYGVYLNGNYDSESCFRFIVTSLARVGKNLALLNDRHGGNADNLVKRAEMFYKGNEERAKEIILKTFDNPNLSSPEVVISRSRHVKNINSGNDIGSIIFGINFLKNR